MGKVKDKKVKHPEFRGHTQLIPHIPLVGCFWFEFIVFSAGFASFAAIFVPYCSKFVKFRSKIEKSKKKWPTSGMWVIQWLRTEKLNNQLRIEEGESTKSKRADFFDNHLFDGWEANTNAEKELQALIRKLLSYEPKERGTADEVVQSLQQIKQLGRVISQKQ